jgi:homoserine kinase
VGNFGPGFDVLSLALDRPGDTVGLARSSGGDEVLVSGVGAERVPREWSRNAACAAIDFLRLQTGRDEPLRVAIHKGVPPGSGLGSSASSSAAAVRAFVELHGLEIDAALAVDAAAQGEAVASGGAHRDDVGAALFGGLVVVGRSPDAVVRLRAPPLWLAVARPDVELTTREMRALIPDALPRADVVANLGNVARLVHACHAQDAELLCRALDDRLSKPYRAPRVPRFAEMEAAARGAGAKAFLLSGSGPAVVAACTSAGDATRTLEALRPLVEKGDAFLARPLAEVKSPGIRLP